MVIATPCCCRVFSLLGRRLSPSSARCMFSRLLASPCGTPIPRCARRRRSAATKHERSSGIVFWVVGSISHSRQSSGYNPDLYRFRYTIPIASLYVNYGQITDANLEDARLGITTQFDFATLPMEQYLFKVRKCQQLHGNAIPPRPITDKEAMGIVYLNL